MKSGMKALTVQQPWAGAIAVGAKTIENRSEGFPALYRGPLMIHAGDRFSDRGAGDQRILDLIDSRYPEPLPGAWAKSAIVAVCGLVDVHPDGGCCRPWGESFYRRHPDQHRTKVIHLVLEDIWGLSEPVAWRKGRLGLWTPPEYLTRAVVDAAAIPF